MSPRSFSAIVVILLSLACGGGGKPTTVDEAEAMCRENEAAGCFFLAELFEGDPKNIGAHPEAYLTYLTASCDRGHPPSCYSLGEIRLTGNGGAQDQPAAARHLETACDGGIPRACYTLGVQRRLADGIPRDLPGARALFERACDADVHQGCANVGQMYTTDELGPQDWATAKIWYARACALGKDPTVCAAAERPD